MSNAETGAWVVGVFVVVIFVLLGLFSSSKKKSNEHVRGAKILSQEELKKELKK
jgi:hypothetical protein